MIRHSAIYEGKVRHRRFGPVEREFEYSHSMFYLDLEETPEVLALHPLYSTRRRGPASFLRSDYIGSFGWPLRQSVSAEVARQTGWTPNGPIRLLTNLRQWGVLANPVSFYFCFDKNTDELRAVLAEVVNTPWGDRQSYVLEAGKDGSKVLRGRFDKAMHVSPLMGMDQVHEIWVGAPGDSISVHITNHESGEIVFDATLNLQRKALTRSAMTTVIARRAPTPFKVLAGIYTQAARAWIAGARWHSRPEGGHAGTNDLPGGHAEGMICPMHSPPVSHDPNITNQEPAR